MSTKILLVFIVTILTLLSCTQSTSNVDRNNDRINSETYTRIEENHSPDLKYPADFFTLSDAEKILGEPAHLTESSTKIRGKSVRFIDSMSVVKKNASIFNCGYMANSKDINSEKTGNVYFLFEQYIHDSLAHKVYSFYKTANEKNGIDELYNLGSEAYFHSDKENFYFIMVRKSAIVFNMKVNKITNKTSLENFNLIAKKIADSL